MWPAQNGGGPLGSPRWSQPHPHKCSEATPHTPGPHDPSATQISQKTPDTTSTQVHIVSWPPRSPWKCHRSFTCAGTPSLPWKWRLPSTSFAELYCTQASLMDVRASKPFCFLPGWCYDVGERLPGWGNKDTEAQGQGINIAFPEIHHSSTDPSAFLFHIEIPRTLIT